MQNDSDWQKLRNFTNFGGRDLFCVRTKGRARGTQVTRAAIRIISKMLVFIINHHPTKQPNSVAKSTAT